MSTDAQKLKNDKLNNPYVRVSLAALDLSSTDLAKLNQNNDDEKDGNYSPNLKLTRAHSLDSGLEKIITVPTIEVLITSNDLNQQIKENVIVPSRNVLNKMPFYSTPLTIEATNNAFRDFMIRLNGMGFTEEKSEAALVATNAESVESAVDFILDPDNSDLQYHRFIPKNQLQDENIFCIKCGLNKSEHIIDSNGNKINQNNNNDYDNYDINDRISISIHNIKQQTLQDIIKKRVDSIGELQYDDNNNNNNNNNNTNTLKEEKEETKKEESFGPKETCGICFDSKSISSFHLASCGHNYCKLCLSEHYRIKTLDGDVLKISCIEPKCDREITELEIISFLSASSDKKLLNKYRKFRRQKLIMLNPSARFCCKPDCNGHMIGSRIKKKLTCPECSTAICYNCSQPWHGYFVGCNQNIDIGYKKWALNKDVQKCPKCRVRIEKDEGCNHMTCQSCKYEFCWICKGPYNDHHFEWWNIFGCPGAQYTPRFCRCPVCFPRWFNRILIILCFLSIIVPIVFVAGVFWLLIIFLVFCVRCDLKFCDIDCF